MGATEQPVAEVEPPTAEPARAPRPRTPKAKNTVVKPEYIEIGVTATFGSVAMLLNKRHWAVHDPKTEVGSWSPAAAELLNKYVTTDKAKAEKFTDLYLGANVVMGLGSMIMARLDMDRQHARQAKAAQLRRRLEEEEGIAHDGSTRVDPDRPAAAMPPERQNGRVRAGGGGASPTHPGRIDGLLGNDGGLT